ncbi:MAG: VCBS repeat-containing protein [Bacteroidetes bacterium]|nr:VCBS repeat-containing protein [Bacteroidota bacterium]
MNNTNNSFSLGYQYNTTISSAAQSFVVADDFNNDSNMDIIMTSAVSPNKMRIFIGSGNGSFVVGTDFNGSTGEIVSGDFNSDGNKDIALAAGTSIICMFGMGNCTFTSGGSVSVGANILSIVPGDFNNDNMLDIASIDQSTSTPLFVRTFLGNNNGTFLANGNYPISAIASGPLTAKDFNNDGFLDIAGALNDNTFFILPGNLLGKFSQETMYSAPIGIRSIISFDTNNDGEEDIISSSEASHKICTFYGNGTLAFNTASVFGSKNLNNTDRIYRVVVADFDCDGKNDIASVSNFIDSISILYNKGGNLWKEKRYKCSGYAQSLVKGDFNGDGLIDIAILDNGITILQNSCSGTFTSIIAVNGSSILNKVGMIARDLNADSNMDLLVINNGDIKIYLGNGNSGFASPVVYAMSMPKGAAVSDYNGDGVLDIAITNLSSSLYILLGIGDGTFNSPMTVSTSFQGKYVSSADFNNDGISDLAVNHGPGSTFGAVSVLIGDGSAGFSNVVTYNTGINITTTTGIADMNGDGKQDMIIGALNSGYTSNPYSSYTYNGLAIYLGNGAGVFTYKPFNVPIDAQVVLPEDIDNDGTIDIVATYNEKITIFTNQSPQISTVSNTTICQPPPVVLKATKNLYSYTWHPGNSSLDSLLVTTSGQYYVSYHNKNNTCAVNSNTITVKVIPTLSISPIAAICFNSSANLNVTGASTTHGIMGQ